jgi:hypothetical protein
MAVHGGEAVLEPVKGRATARFLKRIDLPEKNGKFSSGWLAIPRCRLAAGENNHR